MKTGSLIAMLFPAFVMYAQPGKLVWEENFNSNKIDTSVWNFETGTGVNGDWGTGQLDRATDRKQNVAIKKGVKGADSSCLVITTRAEEFMDRKYTSGRINTKGKASWGPGHKIVARVYARDVKSMGQGFAFWMLPDEKPVGQKHMMWPQGGEIDIMEYVGSIPFHNLGSVHYAWSYENNEWQSWNHAHQGFYYSFKDQEVPNPSEPGYGNYPPAKNDTIAGSWGFHDYGINWYQDRIEFFVDSTVYHIHYLNDGATLNFAKDGENEDAIEEINGKRTGVSEYSNHFPEWHPYEHNMYIILSAGVGGSKNTYGGPISDAAKFPCSVFVDWVRVYEL
ncbi:glycoside hydrolase family 16 protein [Fluviicola sp.]|uniref:glycoside hydrolase family 16 protein n=1 Tax=Fluviicola sp. TaxID=1917219 RepID=UPI0031D944A6